MPGPAQPRVWLLLGDKRGDNGQLEVVAEALGWAAERKVLCMRPPFNKAKPKVGPSLDHLDRARSDPLEPPWPDLVVTIGRRPSMAALWVRRQSGGRCKIALLGKPSGRAEWFDLIVPSAEVVMPPLANVQPVALPLMRVERAAIEAAAAQWRPRLEALPRPLIAVLIGGPTLPFVYDARLLGHLLAAAGKIAAQGGTAYLATSRRTPAALVAALRRDLPRAARLFAWDGRDADNPYRGLLGLADGFVVTADSISMMVEVAQLGRPLAICPLPLSGLGRLDQLRRAWLRRLFAPGRGLRPSLGWLLYRLRLAGPTRDFAGFQRLLIERRLAVPLGEDFATPGAAPPDDLPAVVARIRALVETG